MHKYLSDYMKQMNRLLLVPYIFHYYFLENTVQKMYVIYDRMAERMGASAHQS